MVQTEQIDREIVIIGQFQHVTDKHFHANWNITDANKALETGMTINRFGHHPCRVSEVNHPRVWTDFLHVFNDVENNRNGTQAFEQATGTVSFLTEITVAQRNTLVQFTRFQLANAQLGGYEICIFQRQSTIQRFMHGQRYARFLNHALAQVENNIQLLLTFLHVHQP